MSKKTLNPSNLEALGAERLAALLMEVSAGSADIKRRLRLELSHNLGATELARDVAKRLVSIRKSTSRISWRKRKALIKDLETQVAMIVEKIGPEDPSAAFDLLWHFLEIAPSVHERVDDSRGEVGDVFRAAIQQFADLAPRALLDPDALADRVWTVVQDNGYGEWDGIIPLMAPVLGSSGLARLKAHVEAYASSAEDDGAEDHAAIQFLRQLRGGTSYVADRKARFVKWCLQEIATVAGDTDAYIAQFSEAELERKGVAAEVAVLLVAQGKASDALQVLLNADQEGRTQEHDAWDEAYIECLMALGRDEDAQEHRWSCFGASLNQKHLRAYLRRLPDFDDVEAEEQAKQIVLAFHSFSAALDFFLKWPDLLSAAQLVDQRADEINGDHYALMAPAAESLRARHPLAAVLLWRAMITYALELGRASRYGHAVDHLQDCTALDGEIEDYGRFPTHADFLQGLRDRHAHKSSFWSKMY
ncbi:hypothetical protein QEZ52_06510 [Aliisedimentitalea scapharcae]|uniref:Uncharacterized protein n=1 Tax=Aliisedimentitalea scapharcae TaxID=1524259 RepID=A0ABZ2XZG6_9RHOB